MTDLGSGDNWILEAPLSKRFEAICKGAFPSFFVKFLAYWMINKSGGLESANGEGAAKL